MLWIIENRFSQDWEFSINCFFKSSDEIDAEERKRHDNYAIHHIGTEPAGFGYVVMEGSNGVDSDKIVFKCETKEILDFVYDKIAECIFNHPGIIDLRGEHGWGIEII